MAKACAGEQLYMCAAKRTPCTTARPAEPAGPIVTHPAPPPRPTRASRRTPRKRRERAGRARTTVRCSQTGVTKWGVIVRGFLWVSTSGTHEAMMSVFVQASQASWVGYLCRVLWVGGYDTAALAPPSISTAALATAFTATTFTMDHGVRVIYHLW